MPAAPLVGAVTTCPPAAFSSFTASAQALTQSIASARPASAVERALHLRRAALDLQHARQHAFRGEAALDAGLHDRPDAREPRVHFGRGPKRLLVPAHEAGDRKTRAVRPLEEFCAAAERQRDIGGRRGRAGALLIRALHGAAADRVHLLRQQRRARRIPRREAHAVRMAGQHLVAVEQQVHRLVEGDFVLAEKPEPRAAADARERRLHDRRIELGGIMPLEPEQDRAIRAMAEARERKRAVELHEDLGGRRQQPARLEVEHEKARRQHRAHRVRRRRPDADLEDVEYGDVHRAARRRMIWSAISSASALRSVSSSMLLREHGGLVVAILARELHLLAREELRRPVRHRELRGVVDLVFARLVVGGHGEQDRGPCRRRAGG